MKRNLQSYEFPPNKLGSKIKRLTEILKQMDGAIIAFSGGTDSTFLLYIASLVMGDNILAVIARSETYPEKEINEAENLAKQIGVAYIIIRSNELEDERFARNPKDRCYYCKIELFGKLWDIAKKRGFKHVLDGTNYDDLKDYRPGIKAGLELQVRSPLQEARLSKNDIREASMFYQLPTADKPSMACLSSRFPYGTRIQPEKLRQIEIAENYLASFGIKQVRVRYHGPIARIEVAKNDMNCLIRNKAAVIDKFKSLGFTYITMDLQGFRSGSMNEALDF